MRFAALLFAVSVGWMACSTTPAITVVHVAPGDKAEEVRGDGVKLKKTPQEALLGMRPGYYVVRNAEDWKNAWPAGSGEVSPPPAALEGSTQMLLIVSPEAKGIVQTKIVRALETAELYYVYVRETKAGEGCLVKQSDQQAVDGMVAPRADKPVRFIVDRDRAETCGEAPKAAVQCRVTTQTVWADKTFAQPGDTVECELTSETRGKFEIVDRVLSMADLPAGSSTKLTFNKGPTRASFGIDVYGTFTVKAEAADEQGRRGTGTATISVKPEKSKDVLAQVVWQNFEVSDDPSTFPRVVLRVAEPGPKGQRCTPEIPVPGLCEVRTHAAYTYMKIPASDRKLQLSALYLDERLEKGPGACIHVWFEGGRTVESCDRQHRNPDDVWDIGVIDTTTGKLLDPAAAKAALEAVADAGAPEAGTKKPAVKPATPAKK